MDPSKLNLELATTVGFKIDEFLEIVNRLKAYRAQHEDSGKDLKNWEGIAQVIEILDMTASKLKTDQDCQLEILLLSGKWAYLSLILAEELTDETVSNVINNIANSVEFIKNNYKSGKSDISVARGPRTLKHKLDCSDDENNVDDKGGFTQVKNHKSKKTKGNVNVTSTPIIVNNSFAPLENIMDVDNPVVNVNNTNNMSDKEGTNVNKRKRIDPFWVQKDQEREWRKLVTNLNNMLKTELPMMDSGKFVKIYPQDIDQFRVIQRILTENKVKCFAISPQGTKPFKIIIKGVPAEIPVDEVRDELKRLGFDVLKVAQLKRFRDKFPLPIFQVHLTQSEKNKQIYDMKTFLNFMVVIEAYKFRGVKQCYNCLHFNHSSELCSLDPKCLKCAGNHKTNLCKKNIEDKCKCANCGGEHPANYKGCPKHPLAIKARNAELKTIKDLSKNGNILNLNGINRPEKIVMETNQSDNKTVKPYAQVAKQNISLNADNITVKENETINIAPAENLSIEENLNDNECINADNSMVNKNDYISVNNNKENSNSNNNYTFMLVQLEKIEKLLINICNLCEKLDKSTTAKALGLTNLLSSNLGSFLPSIPH